MPPKLFGDGSPCPCCGFNVTTMDVNSEMTVLGVSFAVRFKHSQGTEVVRRQELRMTAVGAKPNFRTNNLGAAWLPLPCGLGLCLDAQRCPDDAPM
eukprot:14239513-Alexandrium_andersonii.AAC.1